MSATAAAVTLALMGSGLPLWLLALRDPKRLRARAIAPPSHGLAPHGKRMRQVLSTATLLPGVVLIGLGYWPAFLIWLGGLTAGGWLLVQGLALHD
jgi:hypothetical protein